MQKQSNTWFTEPIKTDLQDLVDRLQESYLGYLELKNAITYNKVASWMKDYGMQRLEYLDNILSYLKERDILMGANPSILSKVHRTYIDLKIGNNEYDDLATIIQEIERGSPFLLGAYDELLRQQEMLPIGLLQMIGHQRICIEEQLSSLNFLKKEYQSDSTVLAQ